MASDTSTAMCTYNKEREKKCRRQHEERKSPYNTRASSSFSSFLRYVKKKKLKREGIKNNKKEAKGLQCENLGDTTTATMKTRMHNGQLDESTQIPPFFFFFYNIITA